MTPSQARAMYRREIANGETVTLKRGATTASVRAKQGGNAPTELIGAINQRDRVFVVLAEDLASEGFPVPPKKGDVIVFDGAPLHVEAVDSATRRVRGEIIAYDLTVRGM